MPGLGVVALAGVAAFGAGVLVLEVVAGVLAAPAVARRKMPPLLLGEEMSMDWCMELAVPGDWKEKALWKASGKAKA